MPRPLRVPAPPAPPPTCSRGARSTIWCRRSARSARARSRRSAPMRRGASRPPSLQRLELLERLPAAPAVAHRAARRRPEDVLERGVARAAVGTAERVRLELHELRAAVWARRRGCQTARAQLLAALGGDPVGRPRVVVDHLHVRLRPERRDPLGHRVTHHLERRAAEEGRRELDPHLLPGDVDRPDYTQVDERDHRDLRIGNLAERVPDLPLGYHVAPATERRTIVISSQSSVSSGRCSSRSSKSGSSSASAAAKRGSFFSRSDHIWACIRWYASSRSIFAASPATSASPASFSASIRAWSARS